MLPRGLLAGVRWARGVLGALEELEELSELDVTGEPDALAGGELRAVVAWAGLVDLFSFFCGAAGVAVGAVGDPEAR